MPSTASVMPCAQFLTTGFCKFGSSCLFSHDLHSDAWTSPYHPQYLPPAYEPTWRGVPHIPSSSANTSPCSPSAILNASETDKTMQEHAPTDQSRGPPPSNVGKKRRSRRRGHGQARHGHPVPVSGTYAQPLNHYYPGFFSHPPDYCYLGDRRNTFGVELLADIGQMTSPKTRTSGAVVHVTQSIVDW